MQWSVINDGDDFNPFSYSVAFGLRYRSNQEARKHVWFSFLYRFLPDFYFLHRFSYDHLTGRPLH